MTTTHIVGRPCPNCGRLIDAATTTRPNEPPPAPGDIGVCLYCRHWLIHGDDGAMRNPTDQELAQIAGDKEVLRAMRMIEEYDKWMKTKQH